MKRIGVVLLVACVVQVPLHGAVAEAPDRRPAADAPTASPTWRRRRRAAKADGPCCRASGVPRRRWSGDITRGYTGGTVPFQPWAEALFKKRVADSARDDPSAKCIMGGVPRADFVPYPFKVLEVPGMVVILYEAIQGYRQIFTDGRQLPKDPNPAWMGYSVGRWEGDVFVVESSGFNDDVWLDNAGRPATERAARDRALRAARPGPDGHRDHDRRSEDLHAAVECHAARWRCSPMPS